MNRVDNHGRRGFFKSVLAGVLASVASPLRRRPCQSTSADSICHHTHTGKRLDVAYKRNGEYVPDALNEINAFLQDFRTGESAEIDPQLLDLIYDLRQEFGGEGTYEVISAYRSPKTNDMLRSRSSGVAKNSQHLLGKAIDVRLTGVELPKLRDTAIAMQRGGVGYYERSNFIHVDTGRVRRW